jgi:hypothetical protein
VGAAQGQPDNFAENRIPQILLRESRLSGIAPKLKAFSPSSIAVLQFAEKSVAKQPH